MRIRVHVDMCCCVCLHANPFQHTYIYIYMYVALSILSIPYLCIHTCIYIYTAKNPKVHAHVCIPMPYTSLIDVHTKYMCIYIYIYIPIHELFICISLYAYMNTLIQNMHICSSVYLYMYVDTCLHAVPIVFRSRFGVLKGSHVYGTEGRSCP